MAIEAPAPVPDHPATLEELRDAAAECRACDLWERATQTVFGEGAEGAWLMLVGEQPGDREDVTGAPFVGPAGEMLDRALDEAGIDRRQAYVTNVVKHLSGSLAASDAFISAPTRRRSEPAGPGSRPRSSASSRALSCAWARQQLRRSSTPRSA